MNASLLIPAEVAALLRIKVRTVTKWARMHCIPGAIKTPGGQWRFHADALTWFQRQLDKLPHPISVQEIAESWR